MPHLEVPADVLHAAQQTPCVWGLLPLLAAWYRDARTGRVAVDLAGEALDGSADAMPDDVLTALATTPGLWPVVLEVAQWVRDGRTGRIEVDVVDGGSRELRRVERVDRIERVERLALGHALNVPEGVAPTCPDCGTTTLIERDYGNRYICPPCDRVWTVWDLKRRNAFTGSRGG